MICQGLSVLDFNQRFKYWLCLTNLGKLHVEHDKFGYLDSILKYFGTIYGMARGLQGIRVTR